MDNINLVHTDKVEFILQNGNISSLPLFKEPEGWKKDGQKIVRHKKYHGTFVQFTEALKFYGTAKDYIKNSYSTEGINTRLFLIKRRLITEGDIIKWDIDYIGLADFEEMEEEGNWLTIRFNSNDLEDIIKSHETDAFEFERLDSIDGNSIRKLQFKGNRQVHLKGRAFITSGESIEYQDNPSQFNGEYLSPTIPQDKFFTPRTEIVSQGHPRHTMVDAERMDPQDSISWEPNMFFFDDVGETESVDINIKINMDSTVNMYVSDDYMIGVFRIVEFNGEGYDVVEDIEVCRWDNNIGNQNKRRNSFEFEYSGIVNHKTGFIFFMDTYGGTDFLEMGTVLIHDYNIKVDSKSFADASTHNFIFVDEAMTRLMEIITGEPDKFYSKLFGRKNSSRTSTRSSYDRDSQTYIRKNSLINWNYVKDGEYGFIGLTSGFWLRNFSPKSDKYKSMQMSLKDAIDSLIAVFNVGICIENVNMKQRLRIEGLDYFYRDEVVIELPFQVAELKRKVDKDLFFSGTEMGYEKGGDYENELGLDEPNTTTSTVTPLRTTSNKYTQKSKIRSDDYGMELTRRKPEMFFPDEDTEGDEHNWFLDLKKTSGSNYEQKHWSDRLESEPTGILDPDSYKGFLFTPLRMLLRHGWIVRAGMEQAINLSKKIKYISKNANRRLKTHFIGEDEAISESDDIVVNKLRRSKFLPEVITFKHPINQELMDKILGSTEIARDGDVENVPNVYFKIRFINDKGKKETGYILEVDPKEAGSFKIQKANENLIF